MFRHAQPIWRLPPILIASACLGIVVTGASRCSLHGNIVMRILSKRQLKELVLYSPQHIARLEKAGQFPQRVNLGPARVGCRGTRCARLRMPTAIERVRRRLGSHTDGDRPVVGILTAIISDGIEAVEAACAEALGHGPGSSSNNVRTLPLSGNNQGARHRRYCADQSFAGWRK
jgi:predicted DNA-binding transcriptional regulator AlpA